MNSSNLEVQSLVDTVIKGGYCVGCGACASIENSPFRIKTDEFSKYQAVLETGDTVPASSVSTVCPFSNESQNEDQIGQSLYGLDGKKHNELGYILSTYAGYVADEPYRNNGSSGGMGTWILAELLQQKLVDGVIHVKANETETDSSLFNYSLSEDIDGVMNGAKSRYYPVEISGVIKLIRNKPGRYAVIGLPCFIKSIRLLAKQDAILDERITFCIGLVCGHLKSANFAAMWAWQCGIHPENLKAINFRTKLDNYGANQYGVTVTGSVDGKEVTKISPPLSQLYGADWGWGLFKYKACDYCDDVTAETADITIGDAWLPQYLNDSFGTNVIIIRNNIINQLVKKAREEKRLILDDVSPQDVVRSQSSGFAHRRQGLSYRLYLSDQENKWRPNKRVEPSGNAITDVVKKRLELRIEIAARSHTAFNEALGLNSFSSFKTELDPIIKEYRKTYALPVWKRIVNKIKKIIKT